nr:LEAF RUST 10 DISEASE-RESISTANCE LOCUS RECEPTOR-LIKE PROTEIN KINASE-like 2.4 [Ziziphus jujuba var. spinosa]
MSLTYRVLRLDPVQRSMTLSRSDLWNETCPVKVVNSTFDPAIFRDGPKNTDLTMFYSCNATDPISMAGNWFRCEKRGILGDSYYLLGPVPTDPILNIGNCGYILRVPILQSVVANLTNNRSLLGEALMNGFELNYSIPQFDRCVKCMELGQMCAFDSGSNKTGCVCGTLLVLFQVFSNFRGCLVSYAKPSLKTKLSVGISAAVLGILVISAIILCIRKRECISSKAKVFLKKDKTEEFDVEAFISNYDSVAPKRYSYSHVKKMTNSFAEVVGKGGFGFVYKGTLLDGRLVAVKVLKDSKSNGEDFINEVASMGRTSHVNIVTLFGFCYEGTKRALIYDYMSNGSLDKFIFDQKSPNPTHRLDWTTLYVIALGIARGLGYLHRVCNTRILHFDIKPQNILLDKDFCPKISDFGMAKLWLKKESIVSMTGARGTAGYIAPEVFNPNFGGVSHKSDVYSYGMLVLEMVGGRKNIDVGVSHTSEIYFPYRIYEDIELDKDLRILGVTTEEEKEVAKKMVLVSFWCIQTIPSDRPPMSKVVDMLESNLQSVQIPPKPFLSSPARSTLQSTKS